MRIDRRLTFIGIMLIVLSMTMATQYATTKVGYSYGIVHPSNADIRYIGSDNSSEDGLRVLRVDNNGSGGIYARIELGNWSANQNKTYTAAFGIVNEEPFAVNITHINLSTGAGNYMQIWLHGDRSAKTEDDPSSVFMYNNGTVVNDSSTVAWTLARGDANASSMTLNASNSSPATNITTSWDDTAGVRYTTNDTDARPANLSDGDHSINNASDFVWIQVSLNIPTSATATADATGTIEIHFEATGYYGVE